MHGGTSTGPRTPEGLQRIVKARTCMAPMALRCGLDEEHRRVMGLVK